MFQDRVMFLKTEKAFGLIQTDL